MNINELEGRKEEIPEEEGNFNVDELTGGILLQGIDNSVQNCTNSMSG